MKVGSIVLLKTLGVVEGVMVGTWPSSGAGGRDPKTVRMIYSAVLCYTMLPA